MAYAIYEATTKRYVNKYGSFVDIDDARTFSKPENAKSAIRQTMKYTWRIPPNAVFEVHEVRIVRVR